ncbi:cytochrome c oxidase subunit II [Alsobacter sp. SYSU M60028]|uniref:cytochrome-c oxidase n=1 Tax=Alsobacter ponti TaxID=2962936 RepID=A0ABT1LH89_9HYPH|nr:cytochrome c oxidase subunit II [Alsobacter ponti]MCP8940877.1 cytochrome c oxidase subunit II [Alsobacter ponti]
MRPRAGVACVLPLALAGCQGWQSALDPQGPQARSLADIIWVFTGVAVAVWVLVAVALAAALLRRRAEPPDPLSRAPDRERAMGYAVGGCVALTLVVILALTGYSYATQKELFSTHEGRITILLTGHQFWWDVRYEDPAPSRVFSTANEIHIPVGEPVRIKLEASDVIHSFWVPSLLGKQDLIPGRQNLVRLQADRPGVYRGQCAEFCGWQHAHMSLLVVAHPREEFEAWRDAQLASAAPPSTDEQKEGQRVFLSNPCMTCHTVRGTSAGAVAGPDLTHLASRRMLGAGMLPLTRGNLAAWVVDAPGVKPGVHMPSIKLEPHELHPLLAYLEGLK